jgi:predicted Fe-S protein YdhL (DUF1289 family)
MQSPCIKVCKIVDGYCLGCRRTISEITNWTKYTEDQRNDIITQLGARDDRNMGKT